VVRLEQLDAGDLVLAADEAHSVVRRLVSIERAFAPAQRTGSSGRFERLVVVEDRRFQAAQLRSGFKPNSSARSRRASRNACSASASRPDRYSASMNWPQARPRMSVSTTLIVEAALATANGRFTEGKRLAAEAAAAGGGPPTGIVALGYATQFLAARMEQGRLDEVIAGLSELDQVAIPLPAWRAMLAGALADAGRHTEAMAELHMLVDDEVTGFPSDFTAPLAIRHLVEASRQLGDSSSAAALLPRVQAWAGQLLLVSVGTSIEGASDRSIGHLLATLGRLDEADHAYTAAARLEHAAGFSPLEARTKYWHGRALLDRDAPGDRRQARALLDEVLDTTHRLDMPLFAEEAASLAARLRVGVSSRTGPTCAHLVRPHPGGLWVRSGPALETQGGR
jgi:hypothetical protein